jgi:hypothetical protein
MAGFGAAPKKDDKKKSDTKLKPRQQWDRYTELSKTTESVKVAVRVVVDDSAPDAEIEWFQVGTIRSKDNAYTEAAVVRQRLLISEHSRRIYPTRIFVKDRLEWAYLNKEDEMVVVGKVEMPADIEKMIGFVGLPESSGFYMRSAEALVDNSVGGYAAMKRKGIVGFIGMEVHD